MKSWKTSAAGWGALLTTIGTTLNQLFDGNPSTNPDWNYVLPLVFASLTGIFARDNNVTSEQANAPKPEGIAPKLGLWLLIGALAFAGCVTSTRLAPEGAYAASETKAAQAELYTLDAAFDLAYHALDATFKYERANRALLWKLSPNIKRHLDKLRREAGVVRDDYALARTLYLETPTPAGLNEMQTALNKLQMANVAALNVIEKKGQP